MIRDTLLIIDDSELDLAILNEIFKNMFRVECMTDARRAMTFLHQNARRVCAIVLDICLERREAGFTVLHQIQASQDTAALPVILITTDANEKNVYTGVERGAVDFLVKPVNPHTVQERVCGVVRAAWPPNTTILDREPELEVQPSAPQEEVRAFPQGLTLAQTRALWGEWTSQLERFCCLRPGMDPEGHRQLGEITTLLARNYAQLFPQRGLSEENGTLMGMTAVFCDVGLLAVPDRVLEQGENQQGDDARIYYEHTRLGHELFAREGEQLPVFRYAAEIALWHHKNVDGSGFPQDTDGSAIPLSAQLVRAAMRIQYYVRYYRGCADVVDRTVRILKSEVGSVLSSEVYEAVEAAQPELEKILKAM